MANSNLASTVSRILREAAGANIGFSLGGLLVTSQRYALVARAIDEGKIQCSTVAEFKTQGADELAKGMTVGARYDIKMNAMLFPSASYGSNDGGEERTILHEATHAMFDLHSPKGSKSVAIDDEAAAVLAEAFYIRLCNKKVGGFKMMADGPQEHALTLVDEFLGGIGSFNVNSGVIVLSAEQTSSLRKAVAKDWNFTKYVGADGLPTDASGAKYIYDGVIKHFARWAGQ